MKLLLTKAARINYNAGEVVEVSPAQAQFLLAINAAQLLEVKEVPEKPKTRTRKATTK
jgi:hypothetical protein